MNSANQFNGTVENRQIVDNVRSIVNKYRCSVRLHNELQQQAVSAPNF
jgi:hypothetical protein